MLISFLESILMIILLSEQLSTQDFKKENEMRILYPIYNDNYLDFFDSIFLKLMITRTH